MTKTQSPKARINPNSVICLRCDLGRVISFPGASLLICKMR